MTTEPIQRIAVFSDVHGNLQSLEAVLEAIKDEEVQQLFCCGDIVGYGGNPNECIEMVRDLGCPVVVGNHDYAALDLTSTDYFNEVARAAIQWTKTVLHDDHATFLKNLGFAHAKEDYYIVHASPRSPEEWNYIITMGEAELNFHYFEQKFCFIGHSHQPFIVEQKEDNLNCPRTPTIEINDDARYLVNVGSVGQPRDRDPRACYTICDLEKKTIEIKRIDYDIAGAQRAILDNNLPRELAERLAYGW
jgi:diadenosine tetraphosphatase ApaH/serine/threonine PP2A family protein phosphatase